MLTDETMWPYFVMWRSILIKCYQWTVNVLSDHPRWMFKKNSMEFFAGLQPYLYYYYSGCTLESHDHMFFPECSMITWPCHVIWLYWVPTLFISLLHCMLWGFGLSVQMRGKPFPVWGSHNIKVSCLVFLLGLLVRLGLALELGLALDNLNTNKCG